MSLAATVVMEIRATNGNDSNGGGFDPAIAGGTDYSQQNSAQVVFDGTVITGTTAGASATLTVTGATVDASWAGNLVKVSGGVNVTTGFFEIISVNVGANTITFDRNVATGVASGFIGKLGGAHKTISNFFNATNAGNFADVNGVLGYAKAEADYAEQIDISGQSRGFSLIGYSSTRGDNGRITLTGSNSRTSCVKYGVTPASGCNMTFLNVLFTSPTLAIFETAATAATSRRLRCFNCKMEKGTGTATRGVSTASVGSSGAGVTLQFVGCEITGFTAAVFISGAPPNSMFLGNEIHDNTGASTDGIQIAGAGESVILYNLIYNNGRNGIRVSTGGATIFGNVVAGNGAAGMFNIDSLNAPALVRGNRCERNGTYGIQFANPVTPYVQALVNFNSYYANGTAPTSASNSPNDVLLTGDPRVNATDWSPNRTAGAGADIRDVCPLVFPTGTSLALTIGLPYHPPTLPAVSDVVAGVQYGDAGTEFTGTFNQYSYGQSQLQQG